MPEWFWSYFPIMSALIGGFSSAVGVIIEKLSISNQLKKFSYFLVFIGAVFTITSAVLIAVHQIDQQSDMKKRLS